jgi:hypothetical protein
MKDGRTHLAHKAEHALDLDTAALLAATVQGAGIGDTWSLIETAITAAEQIEAASAAGEAPTALAKLVADRGYHGNQTMVDLHAVGIAVTSRTWSVGAGAEQRLLRHRPWCMAIVVASVVPVAVG